MTFGSVVEKQAVRYGLLVAGRKRVCIVRAMGLFGLVAEAAVVRSRTVCAGCCLEVCCVVVQAGFRMTIVFAGLEAAPRSMTAAACLASLAGIRKELWHIACCRSPLH
jgi:hypothetical protein